MAKKIKRNRLSKSPACGTNTTKHLPNKVTKFSFVAFSNFLVATKFFQNFFSKSG